MDFIDFWSSEYELVPKKSLNIKTGLQSRRGCLLKFKFSEGIGYADLFPWPEFGDESLDVHIKSLQNRNPTELAKVALANARHEAVARQGKIFLLSGVEQIESNILLNIDDLETLSSTNLEKLIVHDLEKNKINSEAQVYKIKIGGNRDLESQKIKQFISLLPKESELSNQAKIRLDVNSAWSAREFESFLNSLTSEEIQKIEYVEDPCEFDENKWNSFSAKIPLAIDWQIKNVRNLDTTQSAKFVVVKPSRQNIFELQTQLRKFKLSVTSSMEHPLGTLWSYYGYQYLKKAGLQVSPISGLNTFGIYKNFEWLSEYIDFYQSHTKNDNKIKILKTDIGLGLADYLESLTWK